MKKVAAFEVTVESSTEKPPIATQSATPGVSATIPLTALTTSCVRSCEAASGSCTEAIK